MHPVASSCFLLFLYFRFSEGLNCPKNSRKIRINFSSTEPSGKVKIELEAHHQAPRRVPGAAQGGGRQGPSWLPWVAPRALLSPIYPPGYRNPKKEVDRGGKPTVRPPPPFFRSEPPKKELRHPAGERAPLRETLHHHGRLPYVP